MPPYYNFLISKYFYVSAGWKSTQVDSPQESQYKHLPVFAQSFWELITQSSNHRLQTSESAAMSEEFWF